MPAYYIEDLTHGDRPDLIRITDGVREWYIPKFRIEMSVEEPILYLYWNDREKGTGGDQRLLPLDYRDVADGYGGYVDNPTSAADLMQTIEEMIVSGFGSGSSGGNILTSKADLLSHNGVSDEILPGGTNEYFLQRVDTESTGLKWVPGSTVVAAGVSVTDTDTVDLTKTGAAISADVKKQMSITSDASGIKLVSDAASPGNSKYYGTDSGGTKGFHAVPTQYTDEMAQDAVGTILADSTTVDLTYNDGTPSISADVIKQMSISSDASGLKLSGDAAAPGNYKYYGTDSAGTKGYNAVIKKQLVYMQCQQSNYPDATTLYFGNFNFTPITALTSRVNVYFRSAGTITLAEIYWGAFATAGSNENLSIYIRLNDTTDYLVQTIGSTDARKTFTNSAINIPIAAGDFITGKIVTPTWATNPTTVVIGGYLEFQSTV